MKLVCMGTKIRVSEKAFGGGRGKGQCDLEIEAVHRMVKISYGLKTHLLRVTAESTASTSPATHRNSLMIIVMIVVKKAVIY